MSKQLPIIIMGVSGSGKSTLGKALSNELGCPFYDADDYHPESNKQKMASGQALDDQDRQPWLERLSALMAETSATAVLACSALKESYRKFIDPSSSYFWVWLDPGVNTLKDRLISRSDHFFPPSLLDSQLETLEPPRGVLKLQGEKDVRTMAEQVIHAYTNYQRSSFGLIGLGAMGRNLAANFLDKGVELSVYNRSDGKEATVVSDFLKEYPDSPCIGFTQLESFVQSLSTPRKILLMIPAGEATRSVVDSLVELLAPDDIIIDGGNAHYKQTAELQSELKEHDLHYLGCGISGGWKGALLGPSMMLGGDRWASLQVLPYLEKISANDHGGGKCVAYLGPEGAGHFVKMIHNGMEYVEMQLLAELLSLMAVQRTLDKISDTLLGWQQTEQESYLLGITVKILRKKEVEGHLLAVIRDVAVTKGTGGWSVQAATELAAPFGMMAAALNARFISMLDEFRAHMDKGSANSGADIPDDTALLEAYAFARLINHHQGFEIIRKASTLYGWNIDLSELARIWTGGCILQSALMQQLADHVLVQDGSILGNTHYDTQLASKRGLVTTLLQSGLKMGISLPCFSMALSDWDAYCTSRSTANLIQAQRDFFGRHGYGRIDRPSGESFNTDWE
jgi:6-phosphogluconate dehydrogenase